MMSKGKLGDNKANNVATQDDINYYLHYVNGDGFINMFIDHMQ